MEMLIYYSYAIHLGIRYSPPSLKSNTWSNPLRGRIVYVAVETGDRSLKSTVAVFLRYDTYRTSTRNRNGLSRCRLQASAYSYPAIKKRGRRATTQCQGPRARVGCARCGPIFAHGPSAIYILKLILTPHIIILHVFAPTHKIKCM